MTSTSKFVYMAHHFILLRLNPFSLRVDRLGWMYQHSLSELRVCLSAEGAKIFFWHWLSLLRGWGSLPMAPTCYGSIPLVLGLISRDSGLNTVSHRCEFACQQKVPKTFPGPGYLRSNDVVVWLWHSLLNLYIWLIISSCYGSMHLALCFIDGDAGLRTLCYNCRFDCDQRVLKIFPGPACLHSEEWIVWLWHLLVNLHIWLTISSCYRSIPLALGLRGKDRGLSTLCHICGFALQQSVL